MSVSEICNSETANLGHANSRPTEFRTDKFSEACENLPTLTTTRHGGVVVVVSWWCWYMHLSPLALGLQNSRNLNQLSAVSKNSEIGRFTVTFHRYALFYEIQGFLYMAYSTCFL